MSYPLGVTVGLCGNHTTHKFMAFFERQLFTKERNPRKEKEGKAESQAIISVLRKFLRRPDARLLEKTSSGKQKTTGISLIEEKR